VKLKLLMPIRRITSAVARITTVLYKLWIQNSLRNPSSIPFWSEENKFPG